MKTYTKEQVKEYIDIYLHMVIYHENHIAGVMARSTINEGKEIIKKAKTEFPEEFKDDVFNHYLRGLENIIQGRPYNQSKD